MDYISRYKHWINSENIDEDTRKELLALEGNDKEIKERFSTKKGRKKGR